MFHSMSPSERMKRVCGASLEELWRVVGRYIHPFDQPVAPEVLAAVREAGLLDFLDPQIKT
jgi:hypothetical protein